MGFRSFLSENLDWVKDTRLIRGVRSFFRRGLNWTTDTVSKKLVNVADRADSHLNANYPLTAKILGKVGLSSRNVLTETRNGVDYLVDTTKDGLRNTVEGFSAITATFLPTRTSVWAAITHRHLRTDFFRAVGRDGIFVGAATFGTLLLNRLQDYSALAYQYFMGKREERENPYAYDKGFYFFALLNLYMMYKFVQLTNIGSFLAQRTRNYLAEGTLDSIVINDRASKLPMRPQLTDNLKKLSEERSVVIFDPRPKAIRQIIRIKFFSSLEALVKNVVVGSLLFFNQMLIGSKFIAIVGWLIRARIMGKELDTSQLASLNISDTHLRRLKGHTNWRSFGSGGAQLGLYELIQTVFYNYTGLNNPLINFGIANLVYNFSMVAAHLQRLNLKEEYWNKEGVNLNRFYGPLLLDPILNWGAAKLEKKLKKSEDVNVKKVDNGEKNEQSEKEEASYKVLKDQKENEFWENLSKIKLSPAARAVVQINAENLIFLLSTFKQSRASGVDYLVKFVALLFPQHVHNIVMVGLKELTDDRIHKLTQFLLCHQKSPLSKVDGPKDDEQYVFITVPSQRLTAVDEFDRKEVFDVTEDISRIDRGVAETLKCYKSGILDVDEVDEHPNSILTALVEEHYGPLTDEREARIEVPPSSVGAMCERVSIPVQQFLFNLQTARREGFSTPRILADTITNGAHALREGIENNVPGGVPTVQAFSMVPVVLGGGVGATIGLAAAAASTIAGNASSIETGVNLFRNVAEGIASVRASLGDSVVPSVVPSDASSGSVSSPSSGSAGSSSTPVVSTASVVNTGSESSPAVLPAPLVVGCAAVSSGAVQDKSYLSYVPTFQQLKDYAGTTSTSIWGWWQGSSSDAGVGTPTDKPKLA